MEAEDRQEIVKVDVRKTYRNLASLMRPYRSRFLILLGIILILESTFVLDKYLFKLVVDGATAFIAGEITREVLVTSLLGIGAIALTITLGRGLFKWLNIHLLNRLEVGLLLDLKRRFFNHLIHLDHEFHTTHKTGSMISKMSRGGRAAESLVDVIVFNFAPIIFISATSLIALWLILPLTAVALLVTMVAFITFGLYILRYQYRQNIVANRHDDAEKADMADYFTNIESIKYYGKEQNVKARYRKAAFRTGESFRSLWNYFRWMDAGQTIILGTGALFIVAIPLLSLLEGKASIGDVTFAYTIFTTVLGPLFGFMHGVRQFTHSAADFESLFAYEQFTKDIKDKPDAQPLVVTEGRIRFSNVTFSYGANTLFSGFSLAIEPNQKVALVGHSGSGKSTLVKLLYRLYDIHEGSITIDGSDIRDVTQESLRGELAIVPQEAVLFDDTIWNNIRFSNASASKERVWEAIRFAQLDKVIDGLPKREHTIVGERGVRLSGGEKQRVSIARALLADKRILVLDEATSALDSQTEHEIQQDLERLMHGRTTIIIAHRLSTVMRADRIVVLDEGRVVQTGTHEELIAKKGQYQRLWDLQKGGYIE